MFCNTEYEISIRQMDKSNQLLLFKNNLNNIFRIFNNNYESNNGLKKLQISLHIGISYRNGDL